MRRIGIWICPICEERVWWWEDHPTPDLPVYLDWMDQVHRGHHGNPAWQRHVIHWDLVGKTGGCA